jgi:hypothetical protein
MAHQLSGNFMTNKNIIIDAIIGHGFNSLKQGDFFEKQGLAGGAGTQWDPGYAWRRDALSNLREEQLERIYTTLDDPIWDTLDDLGNYYQQMYPELIDFLGL